MLLNSSINRRIYKCEYCEYETIKKCDFEKHLSTLKHNIKTEFTAKLLVCKNCNKTYRHRSLFPQGNPASKTICSFNSALFI